MHNIKITKVISISAFVSLILFIFVQAGMSRFFGENQNQREDIINNIQSTKDEELREQQEEATNRFLQIQLNGDENEKFESHVAVPTHLVGLVRQYLAEQLGVEPQRIEVVATEEVVWPDGCLGLPASELCAQGETPGYRITFRVFGQDYVYRTNKEEGFRFEGPGDTPRRP